jgi:hypothetical protein
MNYAMLAVALSACLYTACGSAPAYPHLPVDVPADTGASEEPVIFVDDNGSSVDEGSAASSLRLVAGALQTTRPQLFRPASIDDPSVEQLGDGNLRVSLVDNAGEPFDIVTGGDGATQAELATALQAFPARDNQLALYASIVDNLSDEQRSGLASSDDVAALSDADVRVVVKNLASQWSRLFGSALKGAKKPAGYPASCDGEEGAGARTDQTTKKCAAPAGIMAVHDWPFKYDVTCVKAQGHRGSCVGFASTSAVEMQIAKKLSRWVNLSEQALYAEMKLVVQHTNFGDGLSNASTLQSLIDRSYLIPFEEQWNYNPSYSRVTDDVNRTYSDSCDGYTGVACSNTVHQAKRVVQDGKVGYQMPANPNNWGFRAKHVVSTWDPSDPETSLGLALLSLMAGHSLTIAFPVTQSFKDSKGDGFVRYKGPNEALFGKHGVHAIGFVTNAELATEGPSMPAGDGGGYLIIKNSWGSCAGDGGFYYVPFAWAKDYVLSGVSLTSVY